MNFSRTKFFHEAPLKYRILYENRIFIVICLYQADTFTEMFINNSVFNISQQELLSRQCLLKAPFFHTVFKDKLILASRNKS